MLLGDTKNVLWTFLAGGWGVKNLKLLVKTCICFICTFLEYFVNRFEKFNFGFLQRGRWGERNVGCRSSARFHIPEHSTRPNLVSELSDFIFTNTCFIISRTWKHIPQHSTPTPTWPVKLFLFKFWAVTGARYRFHLHSLRGRIERGKSVPSPLFNVNICLPSLKRSKNVTRHLRISLSLPQRPYGSFFTGFGISIKEHQSLFKLLKIWFSHLPVPLCWELSAIHFASITDQN